MNNPNNFLNIDGINYYLVDVLLCADEPEVFVLKDSIDSKYVCFLLDDIKRRWMNVPVSSKRLTDVLNGHVELRDLILNSETGFVYIIESRGASLVSTKCSISNIDELDLPLPGMKMNWDNQPLFETASFLQTLSTEKNKKMIAIRVISSKNPVLHAINIGLCASILKNFEKVYYHIAKKYKNSIGQKRGILSDCQLVLSGEFDGSFGMCLESIGYPNILGESSCDPIIEKMFDILSLSEEADFPSFVKNSSIDTIKYYRKMLKTMDSYKAEIEFVSASPSTKKDTRQTYWNKSHITKTLSKIDELIKNDEREENYSGRLVGVSKNKKTFEFFTENGEYISGKISKDLLNIKFAVDSKADIKVIIKTKINKINQIKQDYVLIKFDSENNK